MFCIVYVSIFVLSLFISFRSSVADSLVHSFPDTAYNRTSFYLMSTSKKSLEDQALLLCQKVVDFLDFRQHSGTHPTLGIIDNIVFSPMGEESIESTADIARSFAERLHENTKVPIYFYGAASTKNNVLRDIRKKLGYFRAQEKENDFSADLTDNEQAAHNIGVSCVGAVPLILNLNFKVHSGSSISNDKDVKERRSKVSQITKFVREPGIVESLTLAHDAGVLEIACNLRDTSKTSVEDVVIKAELKAKELGIEITDSYTTGPSEQEILKIYEEKFF